MLRLAALLTVLLAFAGAPAWAVDNSLSVSANEAFLKANLNNPGVVERPSGLQYHILQNGFGKQPGAFDTVTVYYKGSLINGKVFDATEPGMPANFIVNELIPGWTEALEIMREGDHWQLVVPPELAYGTRGQGDTIPPNQTLIFDLELVKVTPAPSRSSQGDKDSGAPQ